jgi:hypothetical protein
MFSDDEPSIHSAEIGGNTKHMTLSYPTIFFQVLHPVPRTEKITTTSTVCILCIVKKSKKTAQRTTHATFTRENGDVVILRKEAEGTYCTSVRTHSSSSKSRSFLHYLYTVLQYFNRTWPVSGEIQVNSAASS